MKIYKVDGVYIENLPLAIRAAGRYHKVRVIHVLKNQIDVSGKMVWFYRVDISGKMVRAEFGSTKVVSSDVPQRDCISRRGDQASILVISPQSQTHAMCLLSPILADLGCEKSPLPFHEIQCDYPDLVCRDCGSLLFYNRKTFSWKCPIDH